MVDPNLLVMHIPCKWTVALKGELESEVHRAVALSQVRCRTVSGGQWLYARLVLPANHLLDLHGLHKQDHSLKRSVEDFWGRVSYEFVIVDS